MATKTANVTARIQPNIKEQAEAILERLGIPVSVFIDMTYRQVIMRDGVPFSLDIPDKLVHIVHLLQTALLTVNSFILYSFYNYIFAFSIITLMLNIDKNLIKVILRLLNTIIKITLNSVNCSW